MSDADLNHEFLPVLGHPDDDECTFRSDGTDLTYCGEPKSAHGTAPVPAAPNERHDWLAGEWSATARQYVKEGEPFSNLLIQPDVFLAELAAHDRQVRDAALTEAAGIAEKHGAWSAAAAIFARSLQEDNK